MPSTRPRRFVTSPHDVAEVLVGHISLQSADRLKDNGVRLRDTVLVCYVRGGLERHFGRVDRMIRAVVKSRLYADHRVAGKYALLDAVAQTLFNCGEEVLRHGAADNFLGENEIVALAGLEADEHIAELAVSAGLLLVSALNLDLLADGLSVCNLRHAEIDLNCRTCS